MNRNFENTYCGIFDSRARRGAAHRTEDRIVECFEIEIFSEESGVSHIDGRAYPVRRGMVLCAKPGQIRHSELPIRCNFIRIQPGDERLDRILASLPDVSYVKSGEDYESLLGLMKKLGMSPEGVQRSQTKDTHGNWADLYLYGLLEDDWRKNNDRSTERNT